MFMRKLIGLLIILWASIFWVTCFKIPKVSQLLMAASGVEGQMVKRSHHLVTLDEMVAGDWDGKGSKGNLRVQSVVFRKRQAFPLVMDFGKIIYSVNVVIYKKDGTIYQELYFEAKPKSSFAGVDSVKVLDLNADGKDELVLLSANHVMIVYKFGDEFFLTRPLECRRARIEKADQKGIHEIISEDGARYRWSPPESFGDGFTKME